MKTYTVTVDDVNAYVYETVTAKSAKQAVEKVLRKVWDILSNEPEVIVNQISF